MTKYLANLCLQSYRGVFSGNIKYSIDKGGVQASIIEENEYCVLVFRGSNEAKDWVQNFKASFVETIYGKMHKGFKESWDLVINDIRQNLPISKPLYITGHSYGGALAFISGIYIPHEAVVTFGCPRVMGKGYNPALNINHIRVRNNNDIVTMIPTKSMGYEHIGQLIYLGYDKKVSFEVKFFDRIKSHIKAWRKGQKFNPFYDHDINEYIKKLHNI